jgi:hypothetical protein
VAEPLAFLHLATHYKIKMPQQEILESEESMEKMVEIDIGIALLARRRFVTDNIHYVLTPEEPIYCEVGIIFPDPNYTSRVVKEFARMCREASSTLSAKVSGAKPSSRCSR